jgi:hypothetical protein
MQPGRRRESLNESRDDVAEFAVSSDQGDAEFGAF